MALTLLFIVDPLDHLKEYKDSTVAMMREAARRGHVVHAGTPAELAAHTWLPIDYADGLVRVGVQSAIAHPETAKVLRDLMLAAGVEAPPEGRTLESICIVEVCSPEYDPIDHN